MKRLSLRRLKTQRIIESVKQPGEDTNGITLSDSASDRFGQRVPQKRWCALGPLVEFAFASSSCPLYSSCCRYAAVAIVAEPFCLPDGRRIWARRSSLVIAIVSAPIPLPLHHLNHASLVKGNSPTPEMSSNPTGGPS